MKTLDELFDLTLTTKYGEDVSSEIQAEIVLSLITPKKSLPYYREYGSDLKQQETRVSTVAQLIKLQTSIIRCVQTYNDDLNSKDERRVAVSPDDINFDDSKKSSGEIDLFLRYTPIKDVDSNPGEEITV